MRSTLMLLAALAISGTAYAAAPAVAEKAPEKKAEKTEKAVFAGGCFWCMESSLEEVKGVVAVVSGYTGGTTKNPTYEQVGSHETGHVEAVEVEFDPAVISYEKLLDKFWHNVDPTDAGGQFCDRGETYTSRIFYRGDEQKAAAEASKAKLEKSKPFKQAITTKITEASEFWPAEDYHQDYYKKNPVRYRFYRQGCGRDARLKTLWGGAVE
jgi:peptide-methionine (S)-S-oxide reductase